ncbi:receptor protein EIX2 [Trifolium repens]|nr:receptor protein EIX2 [Trifolium repens]
MACTKIFGYYVIPLLFLFASIKCEVRSLSVSTLCIKEEREALLKIKKDLIDPSNYLSSWVGKDCCNWIGIQCHNQTGNILNLNLQPDLLSPAPLGGKINPSLADLKHLSHLDLSRNDFEGIPIPEFIGSLHRLNYLDLSYANFSGMVPTQLGFLLNLHYLDIDDVTRSLWVRDISWLSTLSSLQYLNMDNVNITDTPHELFGAVNKMSSLLELHLSYCNLASLPPSLPFLNITSLSVLDLSGNPFNSSIPSWLFNLSSLTELHLSDSSLTGHVPFTHGRHKLCKLDVLDLNFNDLTGDITEMIEALSCSNQSLRFLYLSDNQLTGKLPHSLGEFISLVDLDLYIYSENSHTGVSGPIPTSIGNLSNLDSLDLGNNMMNGTIPESIGKLTNLYTLNLLENYWEGTMTNIHLHNLTNLLSLSVSSKHKPFALKVTNDWVPTFKDLSHVEISSCQIGPTFPNWLRDQNSLNEIILENAGISGKIPHWLYNMSSQISNLDLSHNNISGYFPEEMNFTSSNKPSIDFSFNQLKGSIRLWSGLRYLDLSNNYLNGRIPLYLNEIQNLFYLDLSNNYLLGEIPEFWMDMQLLGIIDLSNNSLSGGIPTSICSLPSLYILQLKNNNLFANLSSAFQNCIQLQTLSLENNQFFGSIPNEIRKNIPSLSELLLRGNTLTGSIPEELCQLPSLHLLDLAENKFTGSIPTCLGNVNGFKIPQTYFNYSFLSSRVLGYVPYTKHINLVINGRIVEYLNQMQMHSIIDLSMNDLSREIPVNITQLIHLGALNLSWNHLTGNIPNDIGLLKDLENLDLSHNNLSGLIPASMASMTFLSYLNLSYNNFSGQIPTANQFGTFNEPLIYEGNPRLCGEPLPTNCSSLLPLHQSREQERKHEDNGNGDDEKIERLELYASIAVGFITGFWVVCGSLMLKRSWRHAYFNFAYNMKDKLLILMEVNLARLKRKFGFDGN